MRVLVAVNANSRRGRGPLDAALGVFARAGFSVRVETAGKSRFVPPILRGHAGSVDAFVLAGGDGTLNESAPILIEAGLPVGILPLGTANDLARTLGLPADLAQAAEVIAAGHARRIDLGEVNGRPFFNVAHIGLGATLKHETGHAAKRRWGRFGYAMGVLRTVKDMHPFTAEIAAAGETLKARTVQIAIGNGRHYGGIAIVSEDAQIDDGRLHLYSIETTSAVRLAAIYPSLLRGRLGGYADVRVMTSEEFHIRTRRPREVVADGKRVAETPARFTVRPGALRVFAPPDAPSSTA